MFSGSDRLVFVACAVVKAATSVAASTAICVASPTPLLVLSYSPSSQTKQSRYDGTKKTYSNTNV